MNTWQMIKELTESHLEKEFISYEVRGSRDVLKAKSIDGTVRFFREGDILHELLIGVSLKREWVEVSIQSCWKTNRLGICSRYRNNTIWQMVYRRLGGARK